jgi:hypothetical protein
VNGKPLVYLDSGATAQKPQCVIRCIEDMYRRYNANIHRGVRRLSEEATERYEAARDTVQRFIGASAREEVIFTAGATASLNTAAYASQAEVHKYRYEKHQSHHNKQTYKHGTCKRWGKGYEHNQQNDGQRVLLDESDYKVNHCRIFCC